MMEKNVDINAEAARTAATTYATVAEQQVNLMGGRDV
jgi:hypothetical protein